RSCVTTSRPASSPTPRPALWTTGSRWTKPRSGSSSRSTGIRSRRHRPAAVRPEDRMTTAAELKAAAEQRRRAAGEGGERGGDAAFAACRARVPGVGQARRVPSATTIRAQTERRNGKDLVHTSGYFTRYETPYPMWDEVGVYHEVISRGAGRE